MEYEKQKFYVASRGLNAKRCRPSVDLEDARLLEQKIIFVFLRG
jgi:hypothetical protein